MAHIQNFDVLLAGSKAYAKSHLGTVALSRLPAWWIRAESIETNCAMLNYVVHEAKIVVRCNLK